MPVCNGLHNQQQGVMAPPDCADLPQYHSWQKNRLPVFLTALTTYRQASIWAVVYTPGVFGIFIQQTDFAAMLMYARKLMSLD